MKETIHLNLFSGQMPTDQFLEDLDTLKNFEEKEVLDLIDHIITWYPEEDIDKEWEEWSKDFKENEKEAKKSAISILLFIFTEFASESLTESELRADAEKIGFAEKYVNYSVKKLNKAKEFRKKALRQNQPYRNVLASVDWRIDRQNYGQEFEESVCAIELIYYHKGEKQVAQFDLNLKTLKKLILTLNKIEGKLCQIN